MSGVKGPMKKPNGKPTRKDNLPFANGNVNYARTLMVSSYEKNAEVQKRLMAAMKRKKKARYNPYGQGSTMNPTKERNNRTIMAHKGKGSCGSKGR